MSLSDQGRQKPWAYEGCAYILTPVVDRGDATIYALLSHYQKRNLCILFCRYQIITQDYTFRETTFQWEQINIQCSKYRSEIK